MKEFVEKLIEWLEEISVSKSEEGIIKEYNSQKEDENVPLFDVERREKLLKERPWEINNVDDIDEELVLTYHGILSDRFPTVIILKGENTVEVMDIKVAFCKRDCFRVEAKKIPISFGIRDLMTYAANIDCVSYTAEPDFN